MWPFSIRRATSRERLGEKGEKLVCRYLKKQGYRRIAANYTTGRGEIDLIMQHEDMIVFVEVKTRRAEHYVPGEAAVNYHKQRHITAVARHFISAHKLHDHPCRFDVVAVTMPPGARTTIRHQQSAFAYRP